MEKVLIFGGTAFVGEAIARKFVSDGFNVDILTRGICPLMYNGIHKHILCDRTDTDRLKFSLSGKEYSTIIDVNVKNAKDIINVLSAIDVSAVKKYIMCSTASVFQVPPDGVISDQANMTFSAENKYNIEKKEAEDALISSGIEYVIVRPTYIYGENNTIRREALIFEAIEQGLPIFVPDRQYFINPVYSLDLAKTISVVNEKPQFNNTEILVGGADSVSFEQFIALCSKICQKEPRITRVKQCETPIVRFPFLPMTILVKTSNLISKSVTFTSLEDGLLNVYTSLKKSI